VINASRQSGDGGIPVADRSWDALFYSGARIVDDGYTAEMAIPFKSLRCPQQPPGVAHRWGFQIVREIEGKNQENDVWAPMSREVQSFMAQMGVLEGMTDLSTSLNLELLPTFTAIRFEELDAASGGLSDPTTFPEAGLNLNYGITSNLTADLAINPDFSQIESDQPQIAVNQRFPLFFDEPWKKYGEFTGRARRKEFWFFYLGTQAFLSIASFPLIVFAVLVDEGVIPDISAGPALVVYLVIFLCVLFVVPLILLVPTLAAGVRRMHDIDRSGWWLVVPIVNLVFLCLKGTRGPNRFGADPI